MKFVILIFSVPPMKTSTHDSQAHRQPIPRWPRLGWPHPLASLAGDDAEAVVLDFVNPQAAGPQCVGHGAMNPAGRVRIRNIMPIARDCSRAPQSFFQEL